MSFPVEEATVASIHAAFRDGSLTATQLVRFYLARIEAYDQQGPALKAFVTVNPAALGEAARLDAEFKAKGAFLGPLHGIPIVLKDNFNTKDMPTTAGSVVMKNSRPTSDAFVVERMRRAGAIILGKTNLQEFARGGLSNSSLGGQVCNPYDLTRTPGGSSGGTGAAVAANLAMLGTGSDTGQSIRSPASACSLVGVRPTRGLVSRAGVMPNSFTQDELGPIARTVADAALLLEVMVGYDAKDPVTALGVGKHPASYVSALEGASLAGVRIGALANVFGNEERHGEVNRVMDEAMRAMVALGATVIRFDVPGFDALAAAASTDRYEARAALDAYLAELGPDAPVTSLHDIAKSKTATPDVQRQMEAELAIGDGLNSIEYHQHVLNREKLRILLASKMADLQLDAILYPLQRVLVAPIGSGEQPERNGVLSHGTGFPAVTFPAGFSTPTATAPLGIPVGAEIIALDHSEPKLLAIAHAFEQVAMVRKAPVSTPSIR
ncbi:MAG: gatA [Ramlibacter sp.]|jgi:Asp-tRNA(Asn)/Glu-tRNA(Gln) amidotransferase A subunit family amidase|nr:gatA [Ramlibacter sp.]